MKKIIVAIDGYSSCGKSTMAKNLAAEAGYIYVDTGAMYRAVSLFCMRNGWLSEEHIDNDNIAQHIGEIHLEFKMNEAGKAEIYMNGENVEHAIRTLEVSNGASRVSTLGQVRSELVRQQQLMGIRKGVVMDGRDIGTVVFPEAELKIFLTASPEVRSMRRYKELADNGENPTYEDVLVNVTERDERDENRAESPLRKASDAIVIDNSEMTPDEQQEVLRKLFRERTA